MFFSKIAYHFRSLKVSWPFLVSLTFRFYFSLLSVPGRPLFYWDDFFTINNKAHSGKVTDAFWLLPWQQLEADAKNTGGWVSLEVEAHHLRLMARGCHPRQKGNGKLLLLAVKMHKLKRAITSFIVQVRSHDVVDWPLQVYSHLIHLDVFFWGEQSQQQTWRGLWRTWRFSNQPGATGQCTSTRILVC